MKKRLFILLAVLIILSFIPTTSLYATATSIPYIGASWNESPVTVYISLQKGVNPGYKDEVTAALNAWKVNSNYSFQILNTPQSKRIPADIYIQIKKNTGAVLGSTKISASSGILTSTSITMASQNAMGKPLDRADFRNILRHELGHALGLGHANDVGGEKDLMYPYYDYLEVGTDVYPSALDLDALSHLYGSDGFGADGNLSPIPQAFPY